jgi:hypothetical protein
MFMSSIVFTFAVFAACFSQLLTLAVAGLVTYCFLWCRKQSFYKQTAWTIALIVVLCLWAFFPHGLHVLFPPQVEDYYSDGRAPISLNYSVMFLADVILTVLGGLIAKWIWGVNN